MLQKWYNDLPSDEAKWERILMILEKKYTVSLEEREKFNIAEFMSEFYRLSSELKVKESFYVDLNTTLSENFGVWDCFLFMTVPDYFKIENEYLLELFKKNKIGFESGVQTCEYIFEFLLKLLNQGMLSIEIEETEKENPTLNLLSMYQNGTKRFIHGSDPEKTKLILRVFADKFRSGKVKYNEEAIKLFNYLSIKE